MMEMIFEGDISEEKEIVKKMLYYMNSFYHIDTNYTKSQVKEPS